MKLTYLNYETEAFLVVCTATLASSQLLKQGFHNIFGFHRIGLLAGNPV